MPFRNREEAGRRLADALSAYRGQRPLILAIPRGAVPMASIIAGALDGEIDVVLVHKLGAPGNPELAIGSVDESGHVYISEDARLLGIPADYIEAEKRAQVQTLRQRRALYTAAHPPVSASGRIAIIVDDGIATGASMIAALHAVRAKQPAKVIAATAVAPFHTLSVIERQADEVVCLEVPPSFYAVGQFFEVFGQVSDDDVIAILKHARR